MDTCSTCLTPAQPLHCLMHRLSPCSEYHCHIMQPRFALLLVVLFLSGETYVCLQMILKCADIGHLAASPRTHRRWACQLEEEFFRQVLSTIPFTPFYQRCFLQSVPWVMLAVSSPTTLLQTPHAMPTLAAAHSALSAIGTHTPSDGTYAQLEFLFSCFRL